MKEPLRRSARSAGVAVQSAQPALQGGAKIDGTIIVPMLAIVFVAIVTPILSYNDTRLIALDSNRIENKIFWPIMAVAALALFAPSWGKVSGRGVPAHLKLLVVLLAYCGLSAAWSFNPAVSLVRFALQVMICTAVVLPLIVPKERPDIFFGAFLCFALAALLNVYYIQINNPAIVAVLLGYPGYFEGKNALGQFMGLAFILAATVIVRQGAGGKVVAALTVPAILWCLYFSNSKTAFGLAFLSPLVAVLIVWAGRMTRLSPAVIIAGTALTFYAVTKLLGITMGRLSYMIYKDSTFTGRTHIWNFLSEAISLRWAQGWGYGSFWLAGPGGPSSNAPGWVRTMPSGHNGYLDVSAEIGNIGLFLVLAFVFATLHAIGPLNRRDPARAWAMISLAVYALIYNFIESSWLRSYEIVWLMFLVIAADAAREAVSAKETVSAREAPGAGASQTHGRHVPPSRRVQSSVAAPAALRAEAHPRAKEPRASRSTMIHGRRRRS